MATKFTPQAARRPPFPADRAVRGGLFWGIVCGAMFTPAVLEMMGPGKPLGAATAGCGFVLGGILVGFLPVAIDWLNECQHQAQRLPKG